MVDCVALCLFQLVFPSVPVILVHMGATARMTSMAILAYNADKHTFLNINVIAVCIIMIRV